MALGTTAINTATSLISSQLVERNAEQQEGIDLNEQLVKNKAATFYMKVNTDAMTGAGICRGDVAIVDRSIQAADGKIVIAVVDQEMLIRKLEVGGGKIKLVAVGKKLSPIDVTHNLNVWGVVTYVIRKT